MRPPGTGPGTALRRAGPNRRSHKIPVAVNQSFWLEPNPCQPDRSLPFHSCVHPSSSRNGGSPCISPSFNSGLCCAASGKTRAITGINFHIGNHLDRRLMSATQFCHAPFRNQKKESFMPQCLSVLEYFSVSSWEHTHPVFTTKTRRHKGPPPSCPCEY